MVNVTVNNSISSLLNASSISATVVQGSLGQQAVIARDQALEYANQAANSAAAAANSEIQAANSAVYAANSEIQAANSAVQSANSASQSANSAVQSANSAAQSANSASQSANSAAQSANSATQAANSAAQAANSAVYAANSQINAANSATQAANSATQAANSAVYAANSAINAANSEIKAANSAAQAANSAIQSANSATNSANSAAQAANSAIQAANSQVYAANSAINAANSASQASNSATQAANSAVYAANSAIQAANSAAYAANSQVYAANAAINAANSEIKAANSAAYAANSATAASNSEIQAANSAVQAANSAIQAANSAFYANTSKVSAELARDASVAASTISTTQAQTAQAQASLAAGHAASAASVVSQDLSGITAQALHRSPNAITSMFIYDTSKDSDGGAWTEKCQHTSWWNEAINGKWLGAQDSELNARFANPVSGPELITNGNFANGTTGWTTTSANVSVAGGVANITPLSNLTRQGLSQSFATVVGATYRLTYRITSGGGGNTHVYVGTSYASSVNGSGSTAVGSRTVIFTATATTTVLTVGVWGTNETLGIADVSVRVVTALTTAGGDYFQLTTDGRFYRLSKNLLVNTAALSTQTQFLAPGTYTLSSTTGSSGSVAVSGAATASHTAGGAATTFTVASGGNVTFTVTGSVLTAMCEQGSVATTYEANGASRITEVFRGNKRDFPRLAGIVMEGATSVDRNNIAIYDLTEPGRPMWMAFRADATNKFPVCSDGYALRAISMLNGELLIGGDLELFRATFPTDRAISYSSLAVWRAVFNGGIGSRMSALGYTVDSNIPALPSRAISSIAMTVLPDAPLDPASGLRVPTIWVNTSGGVSRIAHNGTVSNSSPKGWPDGGAELLIVGKDIVRIAGHDRSYNYCLALPLTSLASATWRVWGPTELAFGARANFLFGYHLSAKGYYATRHDPFMPIAALVQPNQAAQARGLEALVSPQFNTGWMPGDIRRVYLADATAETVTGTERITNPYFNTDTSGWTALSVNSAVTWEAGGIARITNSSGSSASVGVYQTLTGLIIGRTYGVEVLGTAGNNATNFQFVTGPTSGSMSTQIVAFYNMTRSGVYPFVATATTMAIGAVASTLAAGGSFTVSTISMKDFDLDRSYKASGAAATITGTITRSQLASGTSLVGYSGFSAANYLREPYSADLDFGTGEWSCSAWVNYAGYAPHNELSFPEDFTATPWTAASYANQTANVTVTPAAGASPFGDMTASKLTLNNGQSGDPNTARLFRGTGGTASTGPWSFSIYAKASGIDVIRLYYGNAQGLPEPNIATGLQYTFSTDTLVSYAGNTGSNRVATRELLDNGWVRLTLHRPTGDGSAGAGGLWITFNSSVTGDGSSGVLIFGAALNRAASAFPYIKGLTAAWAKTAPIAERAHGSGPYLNLGSDKEGKLVATAFDGTTTRFVTTSAAYNTATWLKAEACYTTDGTLSIRVNGREVATSRGNPLLTLNNSSAVLTIGNNYAADAPFPGSIALLKLSATVPTYEQSQFMYEQEKQMFRLGAQSVLPDSGSIVDMAYDDATDRWVAISAANESYWTGLIRNTVTPVPAGSYTRVTATSGIELVARSTTNPGVDVTIPAYGLREELVKRAEAASRLNKELVVYDYVGGFTASTTNGSTAITSVANLTYPASYIGARISGSGIPANTTIVSVSGTTIYLSAPATATATGVSISFLDFELSVGMETKAVSVAGSLKQEGSTKDYTRLYDGFIETVRFAVAPGATAWVQIQAQRIAQ